MPSAGRVLIPLLAVFLVSCESEPEPDVHSVRGRYLGPQFEGRVAVVFHEEIPGVMEAMRMNFRVDRPEDLQTIPRGSAIEFELVVRGDLWTIRNLRVLPDSVLLDLPEEDTLRVDEASR